VTAVFERPTAGYLISFLWKGMFLNIQVWLG